MLEGYSVALSLFPLFWCKLLFKFDVKCISSKFICWQLYYLPRNVTSLQVCVLWASGSLLWLPGKAKQMWLCETRAPFALPDSCWKRSEAGTVFSYTLPWLLLTSRFWPRPNAEVLQQHKTDHAWYFFQVMTVLETLGVFSRGCAVNSENFCCLSSWFQLWPGKGWWGWAFREVS